MLREGTGVVFYEDTGAVFREDTGVVFHKHKHVVFHEHAGFMFRERRIKNTSKELVIMLKTLEVSPEPIAGINLPAK